MKTTISLLKEHTIAANNIIAKYLFKFQNSTETVDQFFTQKKEAFLAKLKLAGTMVLNKSLNDDIITKIRGTHYVLAAGIKIINAESLQNLKAALAKIIK